MTSFNNEASFLKTSIIFSEDPSQMLYNLTKFSNDTGNAVNIRDIGLYLTSEQVCGQQYFISGDNSATRSVYRKVFDLGALIVGINDFATGITPTPTFFTRMYGVFQDGATTWGPIPFVSTAAIGNQISMYVLDVAGVQTLRVTVGATAMVPTAAIAVLEYVKE